MDSNKIVTRLCKLNNANYNNIRLISNVKHNKLILHSIFTVSYHDCSLRELEFFFTKEKTNIEILIYYNA